MAVAAFTMVLLVVILLLQLSAAIQAISWPGRKTADDGYHAGTAGVFSSFYALHIPKNARNGRLALSSPNCVIEEVRIKITNNKLEVQRGAVHRSNALLDRGTSNQQAYEGEMVGPVHFHPERKAFYYLAQVSTTPNAFLVRVTSDRTRSIPIYLVKPGQAAGEALHIKSWAFNPECNPEIVGLAFSLKSNGRFWFSINFDSKGNPTIRVERIQNADFLVLSDKVTIQPQSVRDCKKDTIYIQTRDYLEDIVRETEATHLPSNGFLELTRTAPSSFRWNYIAQMNRMRSGPTVHEATDSWATIATLDGYVRWISDKDDRENMAFAGDLWAGTVHLSPPRWKQNKNPIIRAAGRFEQARMAPLITSGLCEDQAMAIGAWSLTSSYVHDAISRKGDLIGAPHLRATRTLLKVGNTLWAVSLAGGSGSNPAYLVVRGVLDSACYVVPWQPRDGLETRAFTPTPTSSPQK